MAAAAGNIAKDVLTAGFKNLWGTNDPVDPEAGGEQQPLLAGSNHRVALIFHVGFKVMAFLTYMLGSVLMSTNFVTLFVCVVLLLAFDFWTVKNVTGRLLVGLRWWNEVKEDGTSEWRFESLEDRSQLSVLDGRVFWTALWVTAIVWSFCSLSSFFSFSWGWLLCTLVAVALSASNLIGYMKCSKAATQRISDLGAQVTSAVVANAVTGAFNGAGRGGGAGGARSNP
eukprot:CAMPEP_0114555652 /NCGR_PEP_ID=MMETSP0114-20121206/8867_1 /TAXON_ID=31324 /ORGANISM="Goniomonas sp, Strain m" /LENGTH=226 /DNA_ID=CAMNT_0001740799 /DNA_START=18 /DNA_END=698 /DNA_ORIENTATION=+